MAIAVITILLLAGAGLLTAASFLSRGSPGPWSPVVLQIALALARHGNAAGQ
jgi:hypothetical protein